MTFRIGCAIIVILLTSACSWSSPSLDNNQSFPAENAKAIITSSDNTEFEIGSCSPLLESTSSDEEAIRQVLSGEGAFVVAQDIDGLMNLWAKGSRISDAKNTPDNAEDDQVWDDKDAIRHRYVRIVFPGAPSEVKPSNLEITLDGSEAIVMATTNIGDEVSPFGDEWRLVNQNGCWVILSLTYNLEEK